LSFCECVGGVGLLFFAVEGLELFDFFGFILRVIERGP
jgi:hypothetical protein